ncbi:MAG: hypothetical protein IPI48_06195, partial [bacterium]|nr:hypothetical protein [bacterium]
QFPILFADWFDADTIETYGRDCYPGVTGTGSWEVVGGVLAGGVVGDGQCYAMIEHSTWDIKSVRFLFRNTVGSVNGVNVHNAIGNIGLSLNAIPGTRSGSDCTQAIPSMPSPRNSCCLAGVWLDVP